MMEGRATYPDEETLDKVIEELKNHGFYDVVSVDRSSLSISVDFGTYRNLGRNTNLLLEPASEGAFIGVSNEMEWHGFVDTTNLAGYEEFPLKQWGGNHGISADKKLKEMGDDERSEFKNKVEQAFVNEKREEVGL